VGLCILAAIVRHDMVRIVRGAALGPLLPDFFFTFWNLLMLAHLLEFATNHYLLTGSAALILALLIYSELQRGGKSLSCRELTALVNSEQGVIVDVRSHKDFASGHIVDALNIPYDKIAERTVELDKYKGKTIILVDALGQHAGTVCRELVKAGYPAAKLGGGIASWRGDNLPLIK
jgi:rhodanese-related sulfurtransferase